MVFTQIWYLHKQGLQDQSKGITKCAEFTLQWRNYPIWRYILQYTVYKLYPSPFLLIHISNGEEDFEYMWKNQEYTIKIFQLKILLLLQYLCSICI